MEIVDDEDERLRRGERAQERAHRVEEPEARLLGRERGARPLLRPTREQLGRVSSIDALGSFALLPIGYGLAGWATDRLGEAPVFLIGGGATALLLVLVLALQPAVRQLD